MEKQNLIVLYGGRSTEHEVSCRSAKFVLDHLDTSKYELTPIAITKDGRWCLQDIETLRSCTEAVLPIDEAGPDFEQLSLHHGANVDKPVVVFPILHGTFGEDGCTQGFLELKSFAYVGPGVLGSALAMDKIIAKKLVELAGVTVVPYVDFHLSDWKVSSAELLATIEKTLRYPLYVKPCNLGSSVGITKVKAPDQLKAAIEEALTFDDKVLVETGIDAREIEFAVLGGQEPKVSGAGEVVAKKDFYTYASKYEDKDSSDILIPAPLASELVKQGQEIVVKVFKALNLYGLARIDLFLDKASNELYFNEANTLPGFTSISQYPLLWKEAGIDGSKLLDELIQLALDRWSRQQALKRSYS
ncbi:D-alanine--D-alanine ligase family protein [Pseudobacteriovorax antillogorgiicola]|uniref:D-alanine--D-alanine ligase n=1 Tax=Pseudobacteriovorax antillogorgiicola TaxID=1513793 RepID=A0A1Y6CNA9_9BACT|nr:D-alanine--D-alanine ligase family protein [Pseudobacteriovorax antillogorgiicola]TCS45024.1 D-alanine--D-alanine ligase [Pseudobacteriovorax antillogorgiicola]SMF76238.1 D-alanine--D-alanine ligase [Pseudobacteriovorax antillogorgiicola]